MAGNTGTWCRVDECTELAAPRKGGYCWTHAKWKRLGKDMSKPVDSHHARAGARRKTRLEILAEAAIAYADADVSDDIAFERARDNLRKAAERYGLELQRERRKKRKALPHVQKKLERERREKFREVLEVPDPLETPPDPRPRRE